MTAAILWAATVLTAAQVARCESSASYRDGAVVLQTAVNRSRVWRRPLLVTLTQANQFATNCPLTPRTPSWRHLALGIAAVNDQLGVPEWAAAALWYCRSEPQGTCERRCPGGCPAVGEVVHTFFGRGPT